MKDFAKSNSYIVWRSMKRGNVAEEWCRFTILLARDFVTPSNTCYYCSNMQIHSITCWRFPMQLSRSSNCNIKARHHLRKWKRRKCFGRMMLHVFDFVIIPRRADIIINNICSLYKNVGHVDTQYLVFFKIVIVCR